MGRSRADNQDPPPIKLLHACPVVIANKSKRRQCLFLGKGSFTFSIPFKEISLGAIRSQHCLYSDTQLDTGLIIATKIKNNVIFSNLQKIKHAVPLYFFFLKKTHEMWICTVYRVKDAFSSLHHFWSHANCLYLHGCASISDFHDIGVIILTKCF